MNEEKACELFRLLAQVMDEKTDSVSELNILDELSQVIDEKLIPKIESISYDNKYTIIDRIRGIFDDIHFYLLMNELIGRNVLVFHKPIVQAQKMIFSRYSDISLFVSDDSAEEKELVPLSLPVILSGDEDSGVKYLNNGGKVIASSYEDHAELMKLSAESGIDLSAAVSAVSVSSAKVPDTRAYIVLPEHCDVSGRYFRSVCGSADVLIIQGCQFSVGAMKNYRNVSSVLVYGKPCEESSKASAYCAARGIKVEFFRIFPDVMEALESVAFSFVRDNLVYSGYTEELLAEISWHLANVKLELEDQLHDINENLLYKSDDIEYEVQGLRSRYNEKIEETDRHYSEYRAITEDIIERMVQLGDEYGMGTSENTHLLMAETSLSLLAKLTAVYKAFPEENSHLKLREVYNMCQSDEKGRVVSSVLMKAYRSEIIPDDELKKFLAFSSASEFVKRRQIELGEKYTQRCASIIRSMGTVSRNIDRRVIGKYLIAQGNKKDARQHLITALRNGDFESGSMLTDNYSLSDNAMDTLARLGSEKAALEIGKKYCRTYLDSGSRDRNILEAGRFYLNIAASKKNISALKILGEISEGQTALEYFYLAEENGLRDREMFERMGTIFYDSSEGMRAVEYFEKSGSPQSLYMLGMIYGYGTGVPKDEKRAVDYMKKASALGHSEAVIALQKIDEMIKKRNSGEVASENGDYSVQSLGEQSSTTTGSW